MVVKRSSMMRRFLPVFLLASAIAMPGKAQDREVPYWASLRSSEINMRVGPSSEYKINWVYRRQGLPVKVVRVLEGWRLIEDPDGARGWVVARLLSPDRTAIVIGDSPAAMREDPDPESGLKWRLEPGVTGTLRECDDGWCEMVIGERSGFVRQARLWGVDPN